MLPWTPGSAWRDRGFRSNLGHRLAARGFDAAIAEMFALVSAEAGNNAILSIASVHLTLQLVGATPMDRPAQMRYAYTRHLVLSPCVASLRLSRLHPLKRRTPTLDGV